VLSWKCVREYEVIELNLQHSFRCRSSELVKFFKVVKETFGKWLKANPCNWLLMGSEISTTKLSLRNWSKISSCLGFRPSLVHKPFCAIFYFDEAGSECTARGK